MKIAVRVRSLLALATVAALISVFCVGSFAAPPTVRADGNAPLGALNSTGTVMINGNKAISGASIFSGNVISTGQDGVATLDLGQLGRIIVRPSTTITLTVVGNSVHIIEKGKSAMVAVMSGSAQVSSKQGIKILSVSQQNTFSGDVDVTLTPGSVVVVQTQTGNNNPNPGTGQGGTPAGHAFNPPWWSYLILGGVAGGVAAGVATHGGQSTGARTLRPAGP
ncbi:MAG TPA: hypothetical protein VEZ90_19825 [Blastocatellia bacterium]|nr:hypothetical protein [Blastocatellia bacterium]